MAKIHVQYYVLVVAIGSIGHIVLASLCAYPLAKYKFPGSKFINQLIVYSLMFNATVTMIPNFLYDCKILDFGYTGSDHYSWFCIYSWLVFDEKLYGADSHSLLEAAQIDGAGYVRIHF